jgi:CheY-like chemotaxis protein
MAPIPRILIAESDEIVANLISMMLEKKGYSIVGKTASGEESIIRAAELEPDIILMDISLGGVMDGVTAARYLFQLFAFPIVFLTALRDDLLLERVKDAQPLAYIHVPFTAHTLSSSVDLALYNHAIRKKYLDMYPVGEPGKIMADPDPILITDIRGKIFFYNPNALRFLDLPKDQVLMHDWHDVMTIVSDQTGEEVGDPIPEVVRQVLAVTYESNTAVVTKSGKSRRASVILRPVKDDLNDLIGVFIHIRERLPDQVLIRRKYKNRFSSMPAYSGHGMKYKKI